MDSCTSKQIKKSKKPQVTAKDIDQLILNRQRQAEMHRGANTLKGSTLTKEFFEGLQIV